MTSQDLDVLDETDCYLMLRSRTLGRVGVHIADDLAIFPVYYAMSGHDVVFRTSPGTKLNAAVLGTRVVFEVDSAAPGWSVLVRGHAHEIRATDDIVHARTLLGHDWPAGSRENYVQITAEQVTGRRLRRQT
jgi:nitroimidazol reductase NimA-like FMN-containing flavoprotein (pyridoxamine 5'-phosphate oxidase superfamily)